MKKYLTSLINKTNGPLVPSRNSFPKNWKSPNCLCNTITKLKLIQQK